MEEPSSRSQPPRAYSAHTARGAMPPPKACSPPRNTCPAPIRVRKAHLPRPEGSAPEPRSWGYRRYVSLDIRVRKAHLPRPSLGFQASPPPPAFFLGFFPPGAPAPAGRGCAAGGEGIGGAGPLRSEDPRKGWSEAGRARFEAGRARFEAGRARFEAGRARFEAGRARFEAGRARSEGP
jgi:hypothetical protein